VHAADMSGRRPQASDDDDAGAPLPPLLPHHPPQTKKKKKKKKHRRGIADEELIQLLKSHHHRDGDAAAAAVNTQFHLKSTVGLPALILIPLIVSPLVASMRPSDGDTAADSVAPQPFVGSVQPFDPQPGVALSGLLHLKEWFFSAGSKYSAGGAIQAEYS
jgi:hypothetical protein